MAPLDHAEHVTHLVGRNPAVTKSDALVQQAEGITHTARRRPGQGRQALLIELQTLGLQDFFQLAADLINLQCPQVELQAAREDGRRQLLRVGRRQQKLDMRWRLFQGFQQCVKTVSREHVYLVYEVDLVATLGGGVLNVVQYLAGIVNPGAGGCIYLQQVDEPTLVDGATDRALTAGLGCGIWASLAIQRLGQ